MKPEDKLKKLFVLLLKAAQKDAQTLMEIEQLLADRQSDGDITSRPRARHRRNAAPFDPLVIYQEGESILRSRLEDLDIESLRDLIAEGGMDPARLVLKWKSKERIAEHIMNTVRLRAQKGDAFRT